MADQGTAGGPRSDRCRLALTTWSGCSQFIDDQPADPKPTAERLDFARPHRRGSPTRVEESWSDDGVATR